MKKNAVTFIDKFLGKHFGKLTDKLKDFIKVYSTGVWRRKSNSQRDR
jgi:hypothetical protein